MMELAAQLLPLADAGSFGIDVDWIPTELHAIGQCAAPWTAYVYVDDEAMPSGACAFKAPPSERQVEIAYLTRPDRRGRGVARAMVEALVGIAAASPRCAWIVAHTLPEENASTRVLRRSGFEHAGSVVDPDDGPVWRWRRAVTGRQEAAADDEAGR
jgi:RimJ/RimL family protein N-acetyltransferase